MKSEVVTTLRIKDEKTGELRELLPEELNILGLNTAHALKLRYQRKPKKAPKAPGNGR